MPKTMEIQVRFKIKNETVELKNKEVIIKINTNNHLVQ